jgi:hypothetical protein
MANLLEITIDRWCSPDEQHLTIHLQGKAEMTKRFQVVRKIKGTEMELFQRKRRLTLVVFRLNQKTTVD